MNAETIAEALGARKVGGGWMARCPAHDDRSPSLSLKDADDGTVLIHCHAGCDPNQVIAALRARGLWGRKPSWLNPAAKPLNVTSKPNRNDAARREAALAIWRSAKPANGTLVETYLAARGLCLPVPSSLRFHAGLKHPTGGTWPAMVALVTRGADETAVAIHRTFLARDGLGKAPIYPEKMMLGPCRGGAARLAPANGLLMVGEGIETCLAAMQATGNPVWAALSTSGMRALELPAEIRDVIILADGDDPGEDAARDASLRWKRIGLRVRIARPPRGFDFNKLLVKGMPGDLASQT